jgi:hypothetical protein
MYTFSQAAHKNTHLAKQDVLNSKMAKVTAIG